MTDGQTLLFDAFGRQLADLGFVLASTTAGKVTYKSPNCVLDLQFGLRGSNELAASLRRIGDDHGPAFNMDEVFGAMSVTIDQRPQGYVVGGEASRRRLLEHISTLLVRHCEPLLRGDASAWSQLAAYREAAAAGYARDTAARLTLIDADAAWHAKDWSRFIELLDPLESQLGKADLARLDYARRQLE